jgi:UDP-GlcNAc:undecaprenyl-phosphate GlcNAc-1-phosphate transferase
MSQILDQTLLGLFLAAFAGALFGFLPHNFKPAKIFLGDNGSLFIGYMMAAFTLLGRYQIPHGTYATLFIPVLIFCVPIYDTVSVIVVRLSRGINPWEGDRNHFAHRLVKIGMSDKVAVIFSYFIAFTTGHIAVLTTQVNLFGAVLIAIIFISILGVIAFLEYYAAESLRKAERIAELKHRRRDDPK